MRRSSSTTSRCGASSGSVADSGFAARMARTSAARAPGAVGARNEPLYALAIIGIDHRHQEPAGGLSRVRPELGKRGRDALGLQPGELHRQRLALGGDVEESLPAV